MEKKWQQVVQIEACSDFYKKAHIFLGFLAKKLNITIPSILFYHKLRMSVVVYFESLPLSKINKQKKSMKTPQCT